MFLPRQPWFTEVFSRQNPQLVPKAASPVPEQLTSIVPATTQELTNNPYEHKMNMVASSQ